VVEIDCAGVTIAAMRSYFGSDDGSGHCLPQRRNQQRLHVLHAVRLGARFSGLVLVKLSALDATERD
jgi:hypothetical protein